MINLCNNFTLYYNFNTIDVFDAFDLFNDLPIYSLLPFTDVKLSMRIRHNKNSKNDIYLDIDDKSNKIQISNYQLLILIESLAQYIRNL